MAYRTFGDLRLQIERELDLEEEDFVQEEELTEYFNSAVRETEAELIKLGLREEYLKGEGFISVVSGTKEYALPSDIIDTQIRKMVYRNSNYVYTLNFQRGEDAFEEEDLQELYSSSDEYYRATLYKVAEDYKLRLVPTPRLSVTNGIRIIYNKDLNRYLDATTNCDVPEICLEFIRASVKYDCVKKEIGRPDLQDFRTDKEMARKLMTDTLQGQVADPDRQKVDQDLSIYEEHS